MRLLSSLLLGCCVSSLRSGRSVLQWMACDWATVDPDLVNHPNPDPSPDPDPDPNRAGESLQSQLRPNTGGDGYLLIVLLYDRAACVRMSRRRSTRRSMDG